MIKQSYLSSCSPIKDAQMWRKGKYLRKMEERSARREGNLTYGERGLEVENRGRMLKLYKAVRVEMEVKSL